MVENRFAATMLLASLAAAGCRESTSTLGAGADLLLTADVTGTPVSTIVIRVSAPDIRTPMVFNLVQQNGTAAGTIKVPPGKDRTITGEAYESDGALFADGSRMIDVKQGQNPPLSLPLTSKAGHVPIVVTMGSASVTVTPSSATIDVGASMQLTATIKAPNGDAFAASPEWATADPSKASVSSSGLVTALAAGTVRIVATYAGAASDCSVTVK
jgi:hypothetical protein